jgi:hypothetical protein
MIFRPSMSYRWSFPFFIFCCAASMWALLHFPRRSGSPDVLRMIYFSIYLVFWILLSLQAWTTRVIVDEIGIRWHTLRESGRLPWGAISSLGYRREVSPEDRSRTTLRVGLREADTCELRILPFLSPQLYEALKKRLGPLPPEVETEWLHPTVEAKRPVSRSPSSRGRGLLSWVTARLAHWTCSRCGHINTPSVAACTTCLTSR